MDGYCVESGKRGDELSGRLFAFALELQIEDLSWQIFNLERAGRWLVGCLCVWCFIEVIIDPPEHVFNIINVGVLMISTVIVKFKC